MNQSSLEAIETAQGVFCLDKAFPTEADSLGGEGVSEYWDPHKTMLANRYLHGNGSGRSSGNRWFDSAVQVCELRGQQLLVYGPRQGECIVFFHSVSYIAMHVHMSIFERFCIISYCISIISP